MGETRSADISEVRRWYTNNIARINISLVHIINLFFLWVTLSLGAKWIFLSSLATTIFFFFLRSLAPLNHENRYFIHESAQALECVVLIFKPNPDVMIYLQINQTTKWTKNVKFFFGLVEALALSPSFTRSRAFLGGFFFLFVVDETFFRLLFGDSDESCCRLIQVSRKHQVMNV